MRPYYAKDGITIFNADCLDVLPTLAAGSVDSVVTDPPAGIAFMGKEWDTFPTRKRPKGHCFADGRIRPGIAEGQEFRPQNRVPFIAFLAAALAECLRVARPGAYLLCWALPRTSHWTGTAIEDAGWVIQDRITHLFGQGFPKHKSKLKPACEDWWLAWKPDRLVAPLPGLDSCRVPIEGDIDPDRKGYNVTGNGKAGYMGFPGCRGRAAEVPHPDSPRHDARGRYPANVVLDEEAARLLDEQSGPCPSGEKKPHHRRHTAKGWSGPFAEDNDGPAFHALTGGDTGSASRFFYVAKASPADRGAGNTHPTVKSMALMRWLVNLVTPPGGTVLDPFTGSGTTLLAARDLFLKAVGVEREEAYAAIAVKRLEQGVLPFMAAE